MSSKVAYGAGANVDAWQDATSTTFGTSWGDMTGFVRQHGRDTIECQLEVTSGAAAGALTISPPDGWTVDTTKFLADRMPVGTGRAIDSGTSRGPLLCLYDVASNTVDMRVSTTAPNTMTQVTATVPFAFGAGDTVVIEFWLPVSASSAAAHGVGSSASGDKKFLPFEEVTTTGTFTNATYTTYAQRDGDMLSCRTIVTLTGTPGAAALALNPPSGWTVDTSKLVTGAVLTDSSGRITDSSAGSSRGPIVGVWDGSRVQLMICTTSPNTLANVTQAAPFTFAVNDTVTFHYKLPISAGPAQTVAYGDGAGEAYSEWTATTAECTNHTNIDASAMVRRIGKHLWVQMYAVCTGTPAGSGSIGFLVEHEEVDDDKTHQTGIGSGHAWFHDASTGSHRGPGFAHYRGGLGAGAVTLGAITTAPNTEAGVSRTFPFSFAVNDTLTAFYKVPLL